MNGTRGLSEIGEKRVADWIRSDRRGGLGERIHICEKHQVLAISCHGCSLFIPVGYTDLALMMAANITQIMDVLLIKLKP